MLQDNLTDNAEMQPEDLFYGKQEKAEVVAEEQEAKDPVQEPADEEQAEEVSNEKDEDSIAEADDDPEGTKPPENTDEELYVDIGGREITVKQIKSWEEGDLRQSDYTKKTQALANDRREFEAGKDEAVNKIVSEKFSTLDANILELEALIATNDEAMDGLDEYDSEYIDNEKLKTKRKTALESAKSEKTKAEEKLSTDQGAAVQSELVANHPEWLDEKGAQTEVFKGELKNISEYFAAKGWTEQDQKDIKSARVWEAIIVAAKNEKMTGKVKETSEKVRKLPVTTKPRKQVTSAIKTDEELFYGS